MCVSSFAGADFLTKLEAESVNSYMDNICPDTYCGGDINFYTTGMKCSGSTCELGLSAEGHMNDDSILDFELLKSKEGTTEGTGNVLVSFKGTDTDFDSKNGRYTKALFSCVLKDLPTQKMSYSEKEELIYDLVVFECIEKFEDTAYAF